MLVAPLGFLNANDLNEVRLPVVKYLASQRIQFNTDLGNLLHCHPPSFDQSDLPLALPAGGLRPGTKCGPGFLALEVAWRNRHVSCCGLRIGSLDCGRSRLPLVLCGLGVRILPHRASGRAPTPARLAAPPLSPGKSGPDLCFLPRNFLEWPWDPACPMGPTAGARARATSQFSRSSSHSRDSRINEELGALN
jgi:hypothetical protein